jgi:hypothetical protein
MSESKKDHEAVDSSITASAVLPDAIQWPAIVKFERDQELAFARTATECLSLLANCDGPVFVVDANGIKHSMDHADSSAISLSELTLWIRDHAAALDQCCVSKIHVRNVADAISFVAQLEEAR